MTSQLDGKLEPEANLPQMDGLTCATMSIAISLKRIADSLVPVAGQDVGSTLWYIEQTLREHGR